MNNLHNLKMKRSNLVLFVLLSLPLTSVARNLQPDEESSVTANEEESLLFPSEVLNSTDGTIGADVRLFLLK